MRSRRVSFSFASCGRAYSLLLPIARPMCTRARHRFRARAALVQSPPSTPPAHCLRCEVLHTPISHTYISSFILDLYTVFAPYFSHLLTFNPCFFGALLGRAGPKLPPRPLHRQLRRVLRDIVHRLRLMVRNVGRYINRRARGWPCSARVGRIDGADQRTVIYGMSLISFAP